jgi:hypothetical protein
MKPVWRAEPIRPRRARQETETRSLTRSSVSGSLSVGDDSGLSLSG